MLSGTDPVHSFFLKVARCRSTGHYPAAPLMRPHPAASLDHLELLCYPLLGFVGRPDRRWPERSKAASCLFAHHLPRETDHPFLPALGRAPSQNIARLFLTVSSIGAPALLRPPPFIIDPRKPQSTLRRQGMRGASEASRSPWASRSPPPSTASRISQVSPQFLR